MPKTDSAPVASRLEKIARKRYESQASTMVQGILNLNAPVFDHASPIAVITTRPQSC